MKRLRFRTGISLPEAVVALSLLAIVSTILVVMLGAFRTNAEGGSARLEARAIHREAQSRLRLLIRPAMPPDEVQPVLVWPELGNTETELRFHAPANLLDKAVPFDPRTPDYPEFTVQLSTTTNRLTIQRSDATGPTSLLAREIESVEFERDLQRSVKISLTTSDSVRSASGGRKAVVETSVNRVLIHSEQ